MSHGFSRRAVLGIGASLPLMGFSTADSLFAPKPKLLPGWDAFSAGSVVAVDHGAWGRLLAKHVEPDSGGIARVRYGAFSDADKAALDAYIASLSATPIGTLDRPEQLAFWINLYNAAVVRTVLRAYPVASVQDIDTSPGLFTSGPWKAMTVRVGAKPLSLDDIEHGVIRPIWNDPRIHYAVNCAAAGCPNLRGEVYSAARIDQQMDDQARLYVNHQRGVMIDASGGLIVSKIYAWFCDDFGGSDKRVIRHLQQFAAPALKQRLQSISGIADARYDWSLNDIAS